jgi:hypothetical protein
MKNFILKMIAIPIILLTRILMVTIFIFTLAAVISIFIGEFGNFVTYILISLGIGVFNLGLFLFAGFILQGVEDDEYN